MLGPTSPRSHLERAGFQRSHDGRSARLPTSRALPAILLVLAACGAAMLTYFLVLTGGPLPWVYFAAGAIIFASYAGVRSLSNATELAFERGVFRCGIRWPREEVTIALADIARFEARRPAHHRDVPHVVAVVRGDAVRLPALVAEVGSLSAYELAVELACALDDMLEAARRRTNGYR